MATEDSAKVPVNFLIASFEILVQKMNEKCVLTAELFVICHIVAIDKRLEEDGVVQHHLVLPVCDLRFEKSAEDLLDPLALVRIRRLPDGRIACERRALRHAEVSPGR